MRFASVESARTWVTLAIVAGCVLAFMREPGSSAFVVMPLPTGAPAERYPAHENPGEDDSYEIDRNADAPSQNGVLWPREGERWIYRFERKAMATFQGKLWLKLSLGGRAAIELLPSVGTATRFFLLTSEIDRLEMQGQTRSKTRRLPSVRFEVEQTGKVRELRFAGLAVSEEDQDVVKDLVAQWMFFEPETRLGRAEVEWRSPPARGELRTLSKKILRYPSRPELAKLDSMHEWTTKIERAGPPTAGIFGKHQAYTARVDRLEGVENFTLPSANGDFDQQTSYRWLWTSTERVTPVPSFVLGATFEVSQPSESTNSASAVLPAEAIAAGWAKVARMAPQERLRFFRDTKRFLDKNPGGSGDARAVVSLVVRDLRGKSTTSIEWRTGVGILAATSNPEAQGALHELYREPDRSADEKLSILAGVAAGEGIPSPAWKGTFEQQIQNDPEAAVREASVYALGSAIRKETDATKRAELESVLWREIRDARSEPAQLVVLDAIGNSGSGEYYLYLKEQSESSSVRVRAKTALAVRFLAAEQARPILERAKADPSAIVRKAAVQSANVQAENAPDAAGE